MILYLLAEIAGQQVAFDASQVAAVADLGPVTAVPFAPAHVIGLAAIRSQIVTVVDAAIALGTPSTTSSNRAILIGRDTHRYAIRVDRVIDVVALAPAEPIGTTPLGASWRTVALGRLLTDTGFALLIDADALINPQVTIAA